MGWARVTGATLANGVAVGAVSTWNAGNLGAALSANNKIVAIGYVTDDSGTQKTVSSITDSLGNTWSKDLSSTYSVFAFLVEVSIWSTVSLAGTPSSITLNFSAALNVNGTAAIAAGGYSGLSTSAGAAGIDISKLVVGQAAATTYDSGTTAATTSAANELKVGFASDDGAGSTLTAGTLDTNYSMFTKFDGSNAVQVALEDADSGGSGSTARATITSSLSGPLWSMGVVVYKLVSATTIFIAAQQPTTNQPVFPKPEIVNY